MRIVRNVKLEKANQIDNKFAPALTKVGVKKKGWEPSKSLLNEEVTRRRVKQAHLKMYKKIGLCTRKKDKLGRCNGYLQVRNYQSLTR